MAFTSPFFKSSNSILKNVEKLIKKKKKEEIHRKAISKRPKHSKSKILKKVVLLTTGYGRDSRSDNGGWANQTSTGVPLKQGVVAVSSDPKHRALPIGTKVNIEGYGKAVVADVGGGVKSNQLDLCFNDQAKADSWKKNSKVTVYR